MADASTAEVRLVATPEGQARVRVIAPGRRPLGTVLLSHGAGGQRDSADVAALAEALPRDGWVVVLVDQPWRVAGRRIASAPPRLDAAYVPIVERAVQTIREATGQEPLLVGHSDLARTLLARAVPRAEEDLRLLESVMTPQPGRPVKAVAYCFCEL